MIDILGIVSTVFWGLLTISVLVFVHEGGHYLASRVCGVRVTEFFLGLPCRYRLAHTSRRSGTTFGVTPLLLGGYAAVAGMDDTNAPCAPAVLAAVHRRGVATVRELAEELSCDVEEVEDACIQLLGWGSIAPRYLDGDGPRGSYYPSCYASVPRDTRGKTVFDGRSFDRLHATAEGEPWSPPMSDADFFEQERLRTYGGIGFPRRALILVAGILVNIIVAIVLIMSVYSVIGVDVAIDTNQIGSVQQGSPAWEAGIRADDRIVAIDDIEVDSWSAIVDTLSSVESDQLSITYEREGSTHDVTLERAADGLIGIGIRYERYRLDPITSFQVTLDYISQTAQGVAQLLIPTRTMEVLDSSTSIVGISVMSAQAAASGPSIYLAFAGLISLSLGFMNLLPIPPLDGGKLLIEAIGALAHKPVPRRIQTFVSYVGIALFLALFFYMLHLDILRFL